MTFTEMAIHMFPMWLLGLTMIWVTLRTGNGDILNVDRKAVKEWCKFLFWVTAVRAIYFYFTWDKHADLFENISWIPWVGTLTVFWEDAAHTLPLILLMRLIGTSKKTWIVHLAAFLIIWLSFAAGHLYQGLSSALLVSLYIPYSLLRYKKVGLGTFMIGHVLYDLATISLIQAMTRFM